MPLMNNIILFDGECNFCDRSVEFIIKRDKKAVYKFTSIQSDTGQFIVEKFAVPSDIDSMILVKNETCYYKSSAALRICKNLKGAWKLLYFCLLVPKPIRDHFYDVISKNRYKWFGKKDSCTLPSPEIRNRFLD